MHGFRIQGGCQILMNLDIWLYCYSIIHAIGRILHYIRNIHFSLFVQIIRSKIENCLLDISEYFVNNRQYYQY